MNTFKKLNRSILSFILLTLASSLVFAMSLSDAKNAGLIGEQANGYLGLVSKPASNETIALVKSVNTKRKIKYQEIASSKGLDLEVVEKQAGERVIAKTKIGNYINSGSGWTKK